MKEIENILKRPLEEIDLFIDRIEYIKGNQNQLNIILDSEFTINIDKIVEATKIISPILDENNFIKEQYILDVSSKEKGDSK